MSNSAITKRKDRKIAIVGASAVGKSSITAQFTEKKFQDDYYPTIENLSDMKLEYNGFEYSFSILDTAGQDEFSILSNKMLIGIHGYIMVFSITSRQSFEMLRIIRDKILDNTGSDNIPIVLVGNKSDLNLQRQVSEDEIVELSKEFGNCKYIECSAKLNTNITKVFQLIVDEIDRFQGIPRTSNSANSSNSGSNNSNDPNSNSCIIM